MGIKVSIYTLYSNAYLYFQSNVGSQAHSYFSDVSTQYFLVLFMFSRLISNVLSLGDNTDYYYILIL